LEQGGYGALIQEPTRRAWQAWREGASEMILNLPINPRAKRWETAFGVSETLTIYRLNAAEAEVPVPPAARALFEKGIRSLPAKDLNRLATLAETRDAAYLAELKKILHSNRFKPLRLLRDGGTPTQMEFAALEYRRGDQREILLVTHQANLLRWAADANRSRPKKSTARSLNAAG
jgi:hypothetical protein